MLASHPRTAALLACLLIAPCSIGARTAFPSADLLAAWCWDFAFSMPWTSILPTPNPLSSMVGMLLAAAGVLPSYGFRVLAQRT
jgi:hypothetical protein